MPDDKTTKASETAAPDTAPGKPPEQAPVKEPVKTEPPTPEQKPPEQDADKAAPSKDKEAPTSEKAGAEKSPNVSVYNFSEIMAEKKAAEKENAPEKSATVPDKGKEPAKPDEAVKKEPDKTAEPPKRRGRPKKRPAVERNRSSISNWTSSTLSKTTRSRFGMMKKCGPWCPASRTRVSPNPLSSGPGRTAAMRSYPATAARRPASLPGMPICPVSSAT